MNYAKEENGKWIEVQGNSVKPEILAQLGFIPLTKYAGNVGQNERIEIVKIGDVCQEVLISTSYSIKLGASLTIANPPSKTVQYFEQYWQDRKVTTVNGYARNVVFDLSGATNAENIARQRSHIWTRYHQWVEENITSKFTYREDNEQAGVPIIDLVLYMFFGNDGTYPIQPAGRVTPMTNAEVTQARNDVKAVLVNKRQAVQQACTNNGTNTLAAWTTAINNTAAWVLDGTLP